MPAVLVRYTLTHEPDEGKADDRNYAWGPREYQWACQGEKVHYASEYKSGEPGRTVMFDGDKGYEVDRLGKGPTKIRITAGLHSSYDTAKKPDVLLGFAVPNAPGSLPDALALPTARVLGSQDINGSSCVEVEVRRIERGAGALKVNLTACLDPALGMLPRRVSTVYDTDDPVFDGRPDVKEKAANAVFSWEVEEYQLVTGSGATVTEIWFPKRASSRVRDGWIRLVVQEVTIAESLPATIFRPKGSPGDIVFDLAAGKRSGSIIGGPKELDLQVEKAVARAAELAKSGSPLPASAVPDPGQSWSSIALGVTTVIFAIACLAWWQSRS